MKHSRFLLIALLCMAMGLTMTACSDDASISSVQKEQTVKPTPQPQNSIADAVSMTTMTVSQETGELEIERPMLSKQTPMGDPDTWTIFVYLCGSDLESGRGSGYASYDLEEMFRASVNDSVRWVIQTGGASRWKVQNIDASGNNRFVIEDGRISNVGKGNQLNMGASKTLSSFLQWGVERFPAEHMGVILWNHGGGSIAGVCFDETADSDSLLLRELDAAFLNASLNMTDKFEFIGMDACLMGTVEAANILASYGRYMYASLESESANGWDYYAIGSYLAEHPEADGKALGTVVCDSFYEANKKDNTNRDATISVVDLEKIDEVLSSFNSFAKDIYTASQNLDSLSQISKNIAKVECFGSNSDYTGYTNMVDLGDLVERCADYSSHSDEVLNALDEVVIYMINGKDHEDASGLSIFYPVGYVTPDEMATFQNICFSPYYLSYIDKVCRGSDSEYEDGWTYGDGWSWGEEFFKVDDSEYYEYDTDWDTDYWDYLDYSDSSGESELITFDVEPHIDDHGMYNFTLSEEGLLYAYDIIALVYEDFDDHLIYLGESLDVDVDWETGYVEDAFDGLWMSLPDGQNLMTYIINYTDTAVIYASPVYLNDEFTYLYIRLDDSGVYATGTFDGFDESGVSDIIPLEDGDVIVPYYDTADGETYYTGWEYEVDGGLEIYYDYLESADYYYCFEIMDLYGDSYITEPALFNVDENGDVTYYTD
ncbi:MAG: hypothetical protein IKD69_11420 [Solobacterium sp.]|nr:hypothetical protein [Solobacterium sp.]